MSALPFQPPPPAWPRIPQAKSTTGARASSLLRVRVRSQHCSSSPARAAPSRPGQTDSGETASHRVRRRSGERRQSRGVQGASARHRQRGDRFSMRPTCITTRVDVFDKDFNKPADMQGKFVDPTMPTGFVPFGIAALSGQLYVSYAKQDAAKHDETTGAGLGYVDVFDFNGNFRQPICIGRRAQCALGNGDRACRIWFADRGIC